MSEELSKSTLYAIRANDIFPTVSKVINPNVTTKLKRTRDIGALANLVKIIKNARAVITKEQFLFLAANIGIDEYALEHYIRELEELEFINVAGNKIENIVPYSSLDVFERLGWRLETYKPSEEEIQHFELLNNVAEIPTRVVDLYDSLSIDQQTMKLFKKLGTSCGYLDTYVSPTDAKEILYSPIYWDENPEKIFELTEKYQYVDVFQKISSLRKFQGKPLQSVNEDRLLADAVACGCLPTNSVTSVGGTHYFVFTPNIGVKRYEKDIIKKARQIVACVRYGQSFARITKIRSVTDVLQGLLDKGYIGDHSENIHQYAILVNMGLLFPQKAYYGYEMHLNDTPENRRIFEIAIELLKSGTVPDNEPMISKDSLNRVFRGEVTFGEELEVLTTFKKQTPNDTDTLQKIGDILRGVDEDVFR